MTHALIARLERFVCLSDADRAAVSEKFRQSRTTLPGQNVIHETDRADGVLTLIDGCAAQFKTNAEGRRQFVGYFLPGDLVHFGLLASADALFGVVALAPTTTSAINVDSFLSLSSASKALSHAFWHLAIEQLSIAREWIVGLGLGGAEQRLAHFFCEQHLRMEEIGKVDAGRFPLPLSQRDLADVIGMTHVHVNRTLQDMRNAGLIAFDGATLTILDLKKLRKVATFDPHYLQWRKVGP